MPKAAQPATSTSVPTAMPQALVSAGVSPSACMRADSRLPHEKHSVPPSANASPRQVPADAPWRASSGQNISSSPASPSAPPPTMVDVSGRLNTRRAPSAFHSVAVENTTATSPLAMVRLALRKQMKLRQNRHSPCAATSTRTSRRGRRSRPRAASHANSTAAASAKRQAIDHGMGTLPSCSLRAIQVVPQIRTVSSYSAYVMAASLPGAGRDRLHVPAVCIDPRAHGTRGRARVAAAMVTADVFDVLSRSRARLHRRATLGDGLAVAQWSNSFDATRYLPRHHTLSLYLRGGHGTYREDAPSERGAPGKLCLMPAGHEVSWVVGSEQTFVHMYVDADRLAPLALRLLDREPREVRLPELNFRDDPDLVAQLARLSTLDWTDAGERLAANELAHAALAQVLTR